MRIRGGAQPLKVPVAVAGATVTFTITGPNSTASGTAVTDAGGQATLTYTGAAAGTDAIVATAQITCGNATVDLTSDEVTKIWESTPVFTGLITLSPVSATNIVGESHTVTATVTCNGNAESNAAVTFTVTGANSASGTGTTDANGQASFTYTGTAAGTDAINATAESWCTGDNVTTTLTATAVEKIWTSPPVTTTSSISTTTTAICTTTSSICTTTSSICTTTSSICSTTTTVPTGGEGCTPGFWKWDINANNWPEDFYPGEPFVEVFGVDAFRWGPPLNRSMTLSEVLGLGGGGLNALGRQCVAALLNSASDSINYNLTTDDVIDKFDAAYATRSTRTYEALKNEFQRYNEQFCPLFRIWFR